VDAVETVSELFSVSTSNVHSVAFDPEVGSDGDMPAKMLVGTDEGKMIMINLETGKFGNQMGVIDARGFGAGAVRHVRPSAVLSAAIANCNARGEGSFLYRMQLMHAW
jgi:hypothetical protein